MTGWADINMISDALAGAVFPAKQVQFVAYAGAWPADNRTLSMVVLSLLAATYGIFGMWRPLLTYGLLTLTITSLTLFNMMT